MDITVCLKAVYTIGIESPSISPNPSMHISLIFIGFVYLCATLLSIHFIFVFELLQLQQQGHIFPVEFEKLL